MRPVRSSAPTRPSIARAGFTLIELMIVVAIIAILASLAIPQFQRMQLMTRRSEYLVNLKAIATAEIAYEHLHEAYVSCGVSPTTPLDRRAYPFNTNIAGWEDLGWNPDGRVRCHYNTTLFTNVAGSWVRVISTCDMDDDNVIATWWEDVDPRRTSSSSQHMVIRPSTATAAQPRMVF